MKELVEGVYWLEKVRGCNIFLIAEKDGLILIDAGMGNVSKNIETELENGGFNPANLKTIILTHGHADHIGATADLVQLSGAEVMAHENAVSYVKGIDKIPPGNFLGHLFNVLSKITPPPPPIDINHILKDGEIIDLAGGIQVIHTPGHSPGSICLYMPQKQMLFIGDMMSQKKGENGKIELNTPMPMFTVDMNLAKESIHKLKELEVKVICSGHWPPIMENGSQKINTLIKKLNT